MKVLRIGMLAMMWGMGFVATAQAQDSAWSPVIGPDALREFMSGLQAERTVSKRVVDRAEYRPDGTGVLHTRGASFPRSWEVVGESRVLITGEFETFQIEIDQHRENPALYRGRDVETGRMVEFKVTDRLADMQQTPGPEPKAGGAAAPSAAELAKELANPATPLSSLGNNLEFRSFDGDLPGAGDQESWTYTFQPAFPFPQGDGKILALRPAIPIILQQPVFNAAEGRFKNESGLGDMGFDFIYGGTSPEGWITLAGLFGVLPTHTDDTLGSDQWRLGPNAVLGKASKTLTLGAVINHVWDIAGGDDEPGTSLSTINYFYAYNLGGGWQIASGPSATYNWKADSGQRWTIPLGIGLSKTFIAGKLPIKSQLQIFYNVEEPDAFAQDWGLKLTFSPVVKNPFVR